MKHLNDLKNEIHEAAKVKGFWDNERSDETLLMLIITEVAEAVEADRKGHRANVEAFTDKILNSRPINGDPTYTGAITSEMAFAAHFGSCIKDTVEDEFADVIIRCFDLAGHKKMYIADSRYSFWKGYVSRNTFSDNAYRICMILTHGNDTVTKMELALGFMWAWCDYLCIDIEWHIEQKMKYNATRAQMHGKSY